MTRKALQKLAAIAVVCVAASSGASAVGNGLPFVVDENQIQGAFANLVPANSVDFTYHSCVTFTQQGRFQEVGYFWVSSFQDADSEVDSQINHINPNGYRIYGIYRYRAQQWGGAQMTPSGTRLNYVAAQSQPYIELFLDPQQDTVLDLQNCQPPQAADNDISLGSCMALAVGEKSETDGLASGDLEIVFGPNWAFSGPGQALFGNAANFNYLVFNANVTRLMGPLGANHRAEGSGNLFWRSAL